ncbi:MAG: NAD(P)H-dependent oxidoreductase [Mycobacterium sp.]|nr:NAD(P)H-dependent oxidoreductase [Mycobacterium sp.]
MTDILVLVGSLRAASLNRQIAELAVELGAAEGLDVTVYGGLAELPFYDEDLDTADAPAGVTALREAAGDADAVLAVTPEYNGGIPAVLKNAIDWLSRPYGDGAINGKPVAVIGTALGRYGGVWAHDESRKSFGIAGGRVIDSVALSVPSSTLDGRHPREAADVVSGVREALEKLAAGVA